jgi:hypothetical protein
MASATCGGHILLWGCICVLVPSCRWGRPSNTLGRHGADPIELLIYPGASGDFDLYEDEGDSNCYEQGAYSLIGKLPRGR